MTDTTDNKLSGFARIAEASAIALGALGVYLMVALLTFNPSDPSWSQIGTQQSIANAAGSYGAWFADLLLFSFGFMAYSVPFIFGLLTWALFWRPCPIAQVSFFTLGLRLIGFVFTFASLTTMASIHIDDFYFFSSGGLVGDIFTQLMIPVFGLLGTSIILLAVFAGGITLFTGQSWVHVVEQIGAFLTSASGRIASLPQQMNSAKQQAEQHDVLMRDFDGPNLAAQTSQEAESLVNETDSQPIEPSFSVNQPDDDFEAALSEAKQELEFAYPNEAIDPPSVIVDETVPEPMPDINFSDEPAIVASPAPLAAPAPVQKPSQPNLSRLPDMNLLDRPDKKQNPISPEELEQVSRLVEAKLLDFNIQAAVVAVHPGPVITRFE